jgi:phosphatidylglycerol:prolipoprotein diacylglycerol transferase
MQFPEIDPVAFHILSFPVRWYALAYLSGILGGWWLALRNVRLYAEGSRPNADDIENIVIWVVLGIILGGRIGYVLFYNLGYFLDHPKEVFFLWQGGMSFHGGLLGVLIGIGVYAYMQKISLLRLGDVVCSVVPIGLGLGRLSNFANAELYGRVTDVAWGVVFPYAGELPRHPSQIYQAITEGLIIFLILNVALRKKGVREKSGCVSGLFFVLYGAFRFVIEFFREPDAHIGFVTGTLTMGQLLCLPMVLFGLGLIFCAYKREKNA